MRYFLPVLLMLFSIVTMAQNQVTDSSATFVAYWEKGEKKNLRLTRTSQKKSPGKPIQTATNTYEATITVTGATDTSYTMEWVYKDGGSLLRKEKNLRDFNLLLTGMKVIYTTDETGAFKQIENYEEMQSFLNKTFALIAKEAKDGKDTAGTAIALEQTKKIFSSRESVEQLILRDIYFYHTAYGAEYTVTKAEGETELPNFLGGDPWPAVVSVWLAQLKPQQDFARVILDQEIDKIKAADNLKQFATQLAAAAGKEIPAEAVPSYLILNDHNEFDIILSSGWVKRAYLKRFVKTGEHEQTDTYEIILLNH